mmetsp:Transcript_4543/g.17025  ORF Transcript_4543/g.17025 Transcript_4543/m.17025 type:complete len:255 (-) Transcript_4543:526-1290(-)
MRRPAEIRHPRPAPQGAPGHARRRVRAMRRGHRRVRQDLLPRHQAHDPGEAARHLGHLRLVPSNRRARRRSQREPHHPGGSGPVGEPPGGHLRGQTRGHHRRRAVRYAVQVPRGHPALPRHGRRHANGPREAEVPNLRRALRVLLPRGGHRGADVHAHHGMRRELQGRPDQGVQGRALPRSRQPAHQHPAGRGRGRADAQPHLHPARRAGGVWHRGGRDRPRRPLLAHHRQGGRSVEGFHEVSDYTRQGGVRGG